MQSPYRAINYGAIAYILVFLAMIVGFFVAFNIFGPLVDQLAGALGGLLSDALGTFGLAS